MLAACWAHTRRKFYEVAEATGSPVAAEALRRIGADAGQSRSLLTTGRVASRPVIAIERTYLPIQVATVAGVQTSRPV